MRLEGAHGLKLGCLHFDDFIKGEDVLGFDSIPEEKFTDYRIY